MLKKIIVTSGMLASVNAFAACPAGTLDLGANKCKLQGTYTSDLLLTSQNTYVLSGGVFIGNDAASNATLTIRPGTVIKGESGRDYLVVSRGSKIEAEGTAAAPIVFTSENQVRGGWGGLIINGAAPINGCTEGVCQAEGEGSTGLYGGSDVNDNSGTLKYVRVEYAGFQITEDNELNGIAFQGVGAGTTVEYVQVHMGADDGIEFFGGSVNVRNIVVTGARDDSFDWVNGWNGLGQYIFIKQYDDEANNGIEADNLSSNNVALPRSQPTLSNVTLLGTSSADAKGGAGMLLRVGTGAHIYNTIVKGFKKGCIDIDNEETFNQAANGGLTLNAVVVDCTKAFESDTDDVAFNLSNWFLGQDNNLVGPASFDNATALTNIVTPDDFFFDSVDFIGAIRDSASDWTKGWTVGL